MAATSIRIPAPSANPTTFAPADWLSRFYASGGFWTMRSDDEHAIFAGWAVLDSAAMAEQQAIWHEIADHAERREMVAQHMRIHTPDGRRAAIFAHRASQAMEVCHG